VDTAGSPIVTSSEGGSDFVVWILGADGDNKLHAVDGETGTSVVSSHCHAGSRPLGAPLVAKDSIYVPVNGRVYAFRVQ
jgi:outer membrane protein assembly factor BamB